MEQERLKRRVKEAYFFSACVQASYYPFYIVFLKSRNLEYFQIGLCFALSSLVGVICQPVWGYITDKCKYKRNMLLFLMMGSNISVIFILLSHSFITLLLMTIMLSVFMSSVATVLDSIGIEISMFYENMNFNRMRLMNSIGWAVCAVLIGIVVNMTFASSSLLIYITFNTVCMFSVYGINFETKTRSQGLKLQHAFDLFKNKRFTIFVLSTLFLNFSVSVHSNYLEVLIKTTGGSVSILGLVFSIISMCEVPTFFYGNIILKKFNSIDLYKLCIVFYSIRFLLESISTNWIAVIMIQTLQVVTYALYLMSSLNYVSSIVDKEVLTTGLTLQAAIGSGLGGFIGNICGGYILQISNIRILLRLLAFVCIVSLGIVLFINENSKAKKSLEQ